MKIYTLSFCKCFSWILLSLCLSACIRPYKFTIHQGNIISSEKVAEVQPGMSFEQVRYVLGTPLLQDVFHADRWDYIYIEKPGYKPAARRHLAIYFNEGRVASLVLDPEIIP